MRPRREAATGVLFAVSLAAMTCKRPSPHAGSTVDAARASDSSASAGTGPPTPEGRLHEGREPTAEEQQESACRPRTPLVGETMTSPEGAASWLFPWGEDVILREGDRVVRRAGADGSRQVLLEQPGLVSIYPHGADLVLLAESGGRSWIERRPVDRPTIVSAHRDVTRSKDTIQMGEGWYTGAINEISPDRWGSRVDVGHVDAGSTWPIDLPDARIGGRYAGFPVTPKHLYWWVRDARLDDDLHSQYSDFKIRSIGLDGHVEVLRTIEGLVTAFAVDEERVDEPRVAWMDTSEGPCDLDVRPHKGVVWVAPLAGGAPKRVLGGQVCARGIQLEGDDIFWTTESGALWWASARTGQHLLVGGACDHARTWPSARWVYIDRQGGEAGSQELVRVPWWR